MNVFSNANIHHQLYWKLNLLLLLYDASRDMFAFSISRGHNLRSIKKNGIHLLIYPFVLAIDELEQIMDESMSRH
jgi:hypothetical protein